MEFKDYYKVLGVKNDADTATIKAAYRKLARKYHPDKNSEKGAEDRFKEIAEAYHVLKNVKLRAEFDELVKYGGQSSQGFQPPPGWRSSYSQADGGESASGDYSDFFNSIFGAQGQSFRHSGRQQSQRIRGKDLEVELSIGLKDTLQETLKDLEFSLPGDVGSVSSTKKHLKVKIPLGVRDGERIRLVGQGRAGVNGGGAGDLYLLIKVLSHPIFEVSGNNLLISLPLAPWEAALGTKVTVPTLQGKISLSVPPSTSSGKQFRIKGKGLKAKAGTGDLLAVVKIVMPPSNTEKGKALWNDLAVSEHFDLRAEWGA